MTEFQEEGQSKKHFKRMLVAFVILLFFGFATFFGYQSWRFRQGEERVKNMAAAVEEAKKADYKKAMADTYGGKSPKETIQSYIQAVEARDYELASKYFIEGNRERELISFKEAKEEEVNNYIEMLKKGFLEKGSYSFDKNEFIIRHPLLLRLRQYPNGIWKFVEI